MTAKIVVECDGDDCTLYIEHSLEEFYDWNSINDNWHAIDEHHYCSDCADRISKSGELEG